MVNIKIQGLGNFSFSRVPCVGEKVEIDGHVLTVEQVVHHLKSAKEPSASQNLATLITSASVSNFALISDAKNPHFEQKYELESLDFCQQKLKKFFNNNKHFKITPLRYEANTSEWYFEVKRPGYEPVDKFSVSTKTGSVRHHSAPLLGN